MEPRRVFADLVLNKRGRVHLPNGSVYVGRPGEWGNPFIEGRDGTRDEVVALYERWLVETPKGREIAVQARRRLRGAILVCWCAPLACHAYTLVRIANE